MLKKVRRAIERLITASEQSLSVLLSGGHFNPAVSVGLWAGGRFPAAHLGPYVVTQVAGALLGAGVLCLIASGKADFSLAGGFAANGGMSGSFADEGGSEPLPPRFEAAATGSA